MLERICFIAEGPSTDLTYQLRLGQSDVLNSGLLEIKIDGQDQWHPLCIPPVAKYTVMRILVYQVINL